MDQFSLENIDLKFMESIFENISRNTGVKTLVSQNAIEYLENFQHPTRIDFQTTQSQVPLILTKGKVYNPLNSDTCDEKFFASHLWHMLIVYRKNLPFTKEEIIDGFYDTVEDHTFFPIAYRRDPAASLDYFFIIQQPEALRKIFEKKLQIQVKGNILPVVVKLDVSAYSDGQLKPIKCIVPVLIRKFSEAVHRSGPDRKLTMAMDHFNREEEFRDVYISFKNKGVFCTILDQLNGFKNFKLNPNFRIFNFSGNSIVSLEPFHKKLFGFNFEVLDLSNNDIKDIHELLFLKDLNVHELHLLGNPCCNISNYIERSFEVQPSLKLIDGKVTRIKTEIGSSSSMNKPIILKTTDSEITGVTDGITIKPKDVLSHRKNFDKYRTNDMWTLVTVFHNQKYTIDEIYHEISMTLFNEVLFFPCYLRRIKQRDEFFLHNNFDALKVLLDKNLEIRMMRNPYDPIVVHLKLNVAKFKEDEVNWYQKITSAVTNRIKDNILDLNNFPKDPTFSKLFVSFNSRENLHFILNQAKKFNPNISRINAEHCNIANCDGFQFVHWFLKIAEINLKNNNIRDLSGFKKCTMIKEMSLDKNPICNSNASDYVKFVCSFFPHLQYLDDRKIHQDNSIITFQNYIKNRIAYSFVETFLKQFFDTWDSFERSNLMEMYQNSSLLSLSMHYDYDKELLIPYNKIYPRIQSFIKLSRNLLKISNMNQMSAGVFIGKDINQVLRDFPRTKHDMINFSVDVPYYEPLAGKVMIVVGGVFEDFASGIVDDEPIVFGFSRVFMLTCVNDEIFIANDLINVHNVTPVQRQAQKSRMKCIQESEKQKFRDMLPSKGEENAAKLIMFMELTECTKEYSMQLLSETFWDFKVALACFNTYMDSKEISDDKFNFKK